MGSLVLAQKILIDKDRILCYNIYRKDKEGDFNMRILTWYVNLGKKADSFIVKIKDTDTNKVLFKDRYVNGRNVSYNRALANEKRPFVADVISGLIDEYDVMGTVGAPGINAFTGLPVTKKDVDDFLYKYVWG